jgi:hypothetical protein
VGRLRRGRFVRVLFALAATAATSAAAATSASAAASASFDAGDEGWTVMTSGGSVVPPTFFPDGGNPGGFVSFSGNASLRSPASWTGDHSDAYGGRIAVDIRHSGPGPAVGLSELDVFLRGGGNDIYGETAFEPGSTGWMTLDFVLADDDAPPHLYHDITGTDNPAASDETIRATLANLESVLLVTSRDALQVTDVDNIQILPPVPTAREISLKLRGNRFKGKISAPPPPFLPDPDCATASYFSCHPCEVQAVAVYRKRPGPDKAVGFDSTENSKDGTAFTVKASDGKLKGNGKFYAFAEQKFAGGLDCQAARSKIVKTRK